MVRPWDPAPLDAGARRGRWSGGQRRGARRDGRQPHARRSPRLRLALLLAAVGLLLGLLPASTSALTATPWSGTWDTGTFGIMTLTQTGSTVTGTYTYDQGQLTGTVTGNTLTGTWTEAPTRQGSDAGPFIFTLAPDGRSWTGLWAHTGQAPTRTDWNGTCTGGDCLTQGAVGSCVGRAATISAQPGIPAPIFGTPGNDVIVGSDENDQMFGRGGNDLICGGGGNDVILGNEGADTINGEGGDDIIRGGDDQSRDLLGGQKGNDKLFGGPGPDLLVGGSDDDRLVGGDGDDDLFGGPGRDRLFGGERADTLRGEDGNDYLNGGGAPGRLKDVGAGGPGVDTCVLLDFRLLCEKR